MPLRWQILDRTIHVLRFKTINKEYDPCFETMLVLKTKFVLKTSIDLKQALFQNKQCCFKTSLKRITIRWRLLQTPGVKLKVKDHQASAGSLPFV